MSSHAVFLNASFVGFVLALLATTAYVWKARNLVKNRNLDPTFRLYYRSLISAAFGSMFAFIGMFAFLWFSRVFPLHDWIRIVLDILQIFFIIMATMVGRRMLKSMIKIQKRHGL